MKVTVEVDVERPADEVFAYLEDAENNPKWIPNMRSCRWTTPRRPCEAAPRELRGRHRDRLLPAPGLDPRHPDRGESRGYG